MADQKPSFTSQQQEAVDYLKQFVNKTLRIHASDGRIFAGQMKCTDKDSNIILANTHEYRPPQKTTVQAAAQGASNTGAFKASYTSRFVGSVVMPGQHIVKIELEELVR